MSALERREAWGVWGGLSYQEIRIVAVVLGYEPPNRKEIEHGTERGHACHRRLKRKDPNHVICDDCINAYNEATKLRGARYRKKRNGQQGNI